MIIPLTKDSKGLYKYYNLLNKGETIKKVNPLKCKKWLITLNKCVHYQFTFKECTDGNWRIFIKH